MADNDDENRISKERFEKIRQNYTQNPFIKTKAQTKSVLDISRINEQNNKLDLNESLRDNLSTSVLNLQSKQAIPIKNKNNKINENPNWNTIIPSNSLFFNLPEIVNSGESDYKKIDLSTLRFDPMKPPQKVNVSQADIDRLKEVMARHNN
jgi:hypothetical protein